MIKTVRGDITKITDAQAIVNAANSSLLGKDNQGVQSALRVCDPHGGPCLERRDK